MRKECSGCVSYCFSLLLLIAGGSASAQYTEGIGGAFKTPAGAKITSTIMGRIALRRRSGASATTRPSDSIAKVNETSVLFRPTGTQLKTREIANLIGPGNPQVLTILTTILQEFDKGARAAGHPDDLALALSFFLATNASIYHDAGEPPDPPMMELRNTIATALVEDNALNGVTDRQKQELYETLVIFTGFTLATYQEGKQGGNAETVKVGQQLAGQNLLAVIGHLARQDHLYRSGTKHRSRTVHYDRYEHTVFCGANQPSRGPGGNH